MGKLTSTPMCANNAIRYWSAVHPLISQRYWAMFGAGADLILLVGADLPGAASTSMVYIARPVTSPTFHIIMSVKDFLSVVVLIESDHCSTMEADHTPPPIAASPYSE